MNLEKYQEGTLSGVGEREKRTRERENPVREYLSGLWCGRIQERCPGGRCADCHLYPNPDLVSDVEVRFYGEE